MADEERRQAGEIQHTRWEMLQILKRSGGSTVEELAHQLALAPMTIRQHLAVLDREGLVTSRESRKGHGRPSFLYSTTPRAEDLFPKSYDKLARRLLLELSLLQSEDLAGRSQREKVAFVFQRMADRIAGEYREAIHGTTLAERGPATAALLREREGTLSEWVVTESNFEIRDSNCPFQRVAATEPELCSWHLHLLSSMLETDVHMHSCIAQGDSCCRYQVGASREPEQQT